MEERSTPFPTWLRELAGQFQLQQLPCQRHGFAAADLAFF